jgi:hypothetical protein
LVPEFLHEELAEIRGLAAGPHVDWVSLTPIRSAWINSSVSHKTNLDVDLRSGDFDSLTLFLDAPVPPGAYALSLNVNGSPSCGNVAFVMTAHKSDGRAMGKKTFSPASFPGHAVGTFALSSNNNEPSYITLNLKPKFTYLCSVTVQNLALTQQQEGGYAKTK